MAATTGFFGGPIAWWFRNAELPVLTAWKMSKPFPANPTVMERNPYYWQVDSSTSQLPYIDLIAHETYTETDQLARLVAEGKIDMQMRGMDLASYQFYRDNAQKGGYRVLEWRAAATDAYFPNVNCPDPVLARLFDTAAFRQALSLGIDRNKINRRIYNGLGRARQYGPARGSPEYDEGMEKAWATYDPRRANELLDGLKLGRGPDGVRLRPDGAPLTVVVEHASTPGSGDEKAHEMVAGYWNAIGVRTTISAVARPKYNQDAASGAIQIGFWAWDRASANQADPGRWLGTIDDGPWAPKYGHVYGRSTAPREDPPPDHPICKIWDKLQAEPDQARRAALFGEIVAIHRNAPVAIGTVGEKVVPVIVKNNFRNVGDGFTADDTLRDEGLLNPQQFFIRS